MGTVAKYSGVITLFFLIIFKLTIVFYIYICSNNHS